MEIWHKSEVGLNLNSTTTLGTLLPFQSLTFLISTAPLITHLSGAVASDVCKVPSQAWHPWCWGNEGPAGPLLTLCSESPPLHLCAAPSSESWSPSCHSWHFQRMHEKAKKLKKLSYCDFDNISGNDPKHIHTKERKAFTFIKQALKVLGYYQWLIFFN